uniref:Coiled-coil domain-containing protein 186 n=2 Tax=Cacopsylla melanoneura TaxID=428564 RepID=A0A8D8Y863_9HEMI
MIENPADTGLTNGEDIENETSNQSEEKNKTENNKTSTLAKNVNLPCDSALTTIETSDQLDKLSNKVSLPVDCNGLPSSVCKRPDDSATENISIKPMTKSTINPNDTPYECNKETSQSNSKPETNNIEEFSSDLEQPNTDELNIDLQLKTVEDKTVDTNQLIDLKLDESHLNTDENIVHSNPDENIVRLNTDENIVHLNTDENISINDTRQSTKPETVDAFLTDILLSTKNNDVHNENSSLINNVDKSEENTGLLIDVELSSSCHNMLPSITTSDVKHDSVVTNSDTNMDKNSESSQTIFETVNSCKNSNETFDSKTESENILDTNDCKTGKDTKCDSVVNENNNKLGQNAVDENDEKSKQDLETKQGVNKSNKDLTTTQEAVQNNSVDTKGTESNQQDLKEKIGNSLKSIFENNEHLNLLEKQNIANLQSNTMKKVNNLFSSFKSYNFSNFRNGEENHLSKGDKHSPSEHPKENNTSVQPNKSVQEKQSTRPQQNSQDVVLEYSSSSDEMKITLKEANVDSSGTVNDNTLLNKGLVEDVQNSNRVPQGLNNASPEVLNKSPEKPTRPDPFQTQNHSSDDKNSFVKVQDSFVFNSDLIHSVKHSSNSVNNSADPNKSLRSGNNYSDSSNASGNNHSNHIHMVRNASHVPNKSISLNSSPVRNSPSQHDLQDELYLLKETNIRLLGEISWLEEEKNKMKKDLRTFLEETELYKKSMNEQIVEQEKCKETNKLLQEQEMKNFAQTKKHLETKLEKLKKDFDIANKEKEAAVMRYVTKESELITARKDRETADKKYKEAVKEKDNIVNKVKVLATDKARLTQLFDDKCTEYNILQRNLDKVTDEVTGKDIKLKWVQSKLDKELENSKLLAEKLKTAEEKQSNTVEEQVRLKLSEDSQRLFLQEIDVLKKKNQAVTEENNALSLKVQRLEKERLESDEALSKCKGVVISQNEQMSALRNQLANMEDFKNLLHVEHERVVAKDTEVDRVQRSNQELSQDMATCRAREAELLQFTEKLTAKNVRLQSEFSVLEAKAERLEKDVTPLNARIKSLEFEVADLQSKLDGEKTSKDGDNKALARVVAEKTKQVEVMGRELEELRSESQIMKRKHATSIRELNKELSSLKRKCESLTNNDTMGDSHTLGYGSRTSSCQSLNEAQHSPTSASLASTLSSTLQMEPDRAVIIDRFVELQRSHARTIEKLEFLEEHNAQLVNELQKKTRILQNYILREQSGALSSTRMDVNKTWMNLMTKAELSRHGGIMASLYSSKPVDGGMSLELSLEINRKLQAVLEDTILKNITLKENIDTLGEQIEKLSRKS